MDDLREKYHMIPIFTEINEVYDYIIEALKHSEKGEERMINLEINEKYMKIEFNIHLTE